MARRDCMLDNDCVTAACPVIVNANAPFVVVKGVALCMLVVEDGEKEEVEN